MYTLLVQAADPNWFYPAVASIFHCAGLSTLHGRRQCVSRHTPALFLRYGLFRAPSRLLRARGKHFRAILGRFPGLKMADIWTQGAQKYEHLYACSRSMGGLREVANLVLNSSEVVEIVKFYYIYLYNYTNIQLIKYLHGKL